jgi:hypothetical protein
MNMSVSMDKYNPDHNYVVESEEHQRENLKSYLKTLDRKDLIGVLFDESHISDVKLDRWDMATIAGLIIDLKFGKEEE